MPTPLATVALPTLARGTQSLCCFTKCCPCVNLSFLKTREGILKLLEIILGSICHNLLIGYGIAYILALGSSFYSFLTACAAGMVTSFVLLLCYLIAPSSVHSLRSSLFETLFNAFASLLYLSSSCYLAFALHTYLYPVDKFMSIFQVYSAMSGTYVVGFLLCLVHAYDAYLAYNT